MPLANTNRSFGTVTRMLHWLTALLILTNFPLGLIANDMGFETSEALAQKAFLFSLHKSLGVAIFFVALARILWALTQTRPAPLHPQRKMETLLAAVVHWLLYASLLAVPLTGWVEHAASEGFAPILWALPQGLPLVPKDLHLAEVAGSLHWVFTKLLAVSILMHILGALKHHLIDKDATLRRMWSGVAAPERPVRQGGHVLPALLALAVYVAGATLAVALVKPAPPPAETQTEASTTGNWKVESGSLRINVVQMAAKVEGRFETWDAVINFTPTADGPVGDVRVTVDLGSLTLGAVTTQALGPDLLNADAHPQAVFEAQLHPVLDAYEAQGTLTLNGVSMPLMLEFRLDIDGDRAKMTGSTVIDRRDFGIGTRYPDDKSVGFEVGVQTDLIASRVKD